MIEGILDFSLLIKIFGAIYNNNSEFNETYSLIDYHQSYNIFLQTKLTKSLILPHLWFQSIPQQRNIIIKTKSLIKNHKIHQQCALYKDLN